MKIYLRPTADRPEGGDLIPCITSGDGKRVIVLSTVCPACREPLSVRGVDQHTEDDRVVVAHAVALCCRTVVGQLRVEMDTLFGLEEDERVLHGRARVY